MVPLGHPEVKGVFLWRQLSRDIQGPVWKRDLLMVNIRWDPWKQQIQGLEFYRHKGVWDSSLQQCFWKPFLL